MLVFMHSFTMYGGSWAFPEGIHSISAYWWVAKVSFSCLLETFVFISGYLLCFQMQNKGITFSSLIQNKAKRIYLPCIVFSIIYFCCFKTYTTLPKFLYSLLNGCGHLWFLPMLFWCFIGGYLLLKARIPEWSKIVLLVALSLFSKQLSFLPFRIGNSCYYLLFFYIGSVVYTHKDNVLCFFTKKKIVWLVVGYATTMILGLLLLRYLQSIDSNIPSQHIAIMLGETATKVIYAILGTMVLYLIANHIPNKQQYTNVISTLNMCSFSIYIYHQFILEYLYYHTTLPKMVGSLWLPWIGFFATITFTILYSYTTKKI